MADESSYSAEVIEFQRRPNEVDFTNYSWMEIVASRPLRRWIKQKLNIKIRNFKGNKIRNDGVKKMLIITWW